MSQEDYTSEEIGAGVAASWDGGDDAVPNLMRIYQLAQWQDPALANPDRHDYGVEDQLELDFQDIGIGLQDWSDYRVLTFWMSLDNWKKVSGSRETSRMFYFRVRLQDDPDNFAYLGLSTDGFYLSEHHYGYDSSEEPGDGVWKKVRVPLSGIDPTRPFDINSVDEIRFDLRGLKLSWYNASNVQQWIDYNLSEPDDYGVQGKFVFHLGAPDSYNRNEYPVRFREESIFKHWLYYTDAGATDPHQMPEDPGHCASCDHVIQWNPDPTTTDMETLYFEDHFSPNLRIDQIQVPGKPAQNTILEYGLPRCFRYAITHLTEHKTF